MSVHALGWKTLGRGLGSRAGRRTAGLCLALVALLPFSGRAERLRSVEARNVTLAIYSDDSSALVAVLKVGRVFNENRRLGFFRVKLLPVLVAQGVRNHR